MALFDHILGGGNWVTGLAIGVGAVIILPLPPQFSGRGRRLRSRAAFWAYRGGAGLVEGIGDFVAEITAEAGEKVVQEAVEAAAEATGRPSRGAANAMGRRSIS